jgi:hypothetical protein
MKKSPKNLQEPTKNPQKAYKKRLKIYCFFSLIEIQIHRKVQIHILFMSTHK